jgi:hypothetical protein
MVGIIEDAVHVDGNPRRNADYAEIIIGGNNRPDA